MDPRQQIPWQTVVTHTSDRLHHVHDSQQSRMQRTPEKDPAQKIVARHPTHINIEMFVYQAPGTRLTAISDVGGIAPLERE